MTDFADSTDAPDQITSLHLLGRARPDDVAISDTERALTFGELGALASGVAVALMERDDGGEAPVPVLVERSVASAVGVLGVMAAGRTVCPIDADDPPARIRELLARVDAGVAVDATSRRRGAAVLADTVSAPVVVADVHPTAPVHRPVPAGSLSALVFTSGSTGVPKGVMYAADNTTAQFKLRRSRVTVLGVERQPVFAPFSFVAGLGKITYDLLCGCEILIADPSTFTPESLADWIEQHGFFTFNLTPSMARVWAQRLGGRRLEGVRRVATYGEQLTWDDVAAVRAVVHPEATIETLYGASEAPSSGLLMSVPVEMPLGDGFVPLGYERLPGTVRLEPVSDEPGAPSELVLCGPIALGYWKDPELTARKFGVRDDGVRFWRSGDIAVRAEDGLFHNRGRVDDLVKIRGKLAEPAEPERVLRAVAGVRNAVVLPRHLPAGAVRLVAHVEVDDGTEPGALRDALRTSLPAHLVPSLLVRHESIPLTPRNKVDRQLLHTAPLRPWRAAPARPAQGEVELVVTGVVTRVLGVGEVGPDDDLWDLGCDSLAAVEIVAELNDLGFARVGLDDLVDATTPAAIAARLARPTTTPPAPFVALNADGAEPPLWAFPGAGGSALAFRALAAALGADQPVSVVEPNGVHRGSRVDLSVESAAARALPVVRAAQPQGPYVLVGHSLGGLVAYEVARRLHAEGDAVRVVVLDAPAPADPASLSHSDRAIVGEWMTTTGVEGASTAAHAGQRRTWRSVRTAVGDRVGMAAMVAGVRPRRLGRRYEVLFHLGSRVARRYRPTPSEVPVTVVHVGGGLVPASWARVVDDVTAHRVGGDHNSLLQPPHVAEVAAAIRTVMPVGEHA